MVVSALMEFEAVEEEVGVELGAQGAQFGVLGQDAQLGAPGLGLLAALHGVQQVVQGEGGQVEHHAHAQEGGEGRPGLGVEPARGAGACPGTRPGAWPPRPRVPT